MNETQALARASTYATVKTSNLEGVDKMMQKASKELCVAWKIAHPNAPICVAGSLNMPVEQHPCYRKR